MSTVKITQLPFFNTIDANTSNTIFVGVDIPTDATFQMSAHALAKGLYSNEILNVGGNPVLFTNTIAQLANTDPEFLQINLQNFNSLGSGDYIVTGDQGTNSNNYIDMGLNGSNFQVNPTVGTAFLPIDGYLYVQGNGVNYKGNLIIGATASNTTINFIVGGANQQNIVAKMTSTGLVMNTQSYIVFGDGTVQSTAAATNAYSQAAFALANSVNAGVTYITGVDLQQNTNITAVNTYTSSGYALANTVNAGVTYITGVDLQQNTNITAVNTYANSGYAQANAATISAQSGYNLANTVSTTANAAYLQANAATNSAQSGYNLANTVSTTANAAYLQANAATNSAQSGYNLANTVSTTANASFVQANAANQYANTAYAQANAATNSAQYAYTNANAAFTYANNTLIYSQAGFAVANSAQSNTIILQGGLNSANANIVYLFGIAAGQNSYAQSIGVTANAALPNTTGTFGGSLTITGNLIANTAATSANFQKVNILGNNDGSLTINNSSFSAQTALVKIIGSTGFASQTPINPGYMMQIVGQDNTPTRIVLDSASVTGNAYGLIAGRTSRGSAASPSATQAGDVLMRISGNGYGTTKYPQLGTAKIDFVAAENYTDANNGSRIHFSVTRLGSNTVYANVVTIGSNTVSFGTNNYAQSNTIIDMTNSRIQVSNTSTTINKTAYALSYVNFTPSYPNGSPGDKKGMMFLDVGNAIGNGVKMYWCNADYTTGASQIWYTQLAPQAAWG